VGQALWFAQPVLLGCAVLVWTAVASFVHWYEEPHLAERYGESYRAYRDAVPAWIPRAFARGARMATSPLSRGAS